MSTNNITKLTGHRNNKFTGQFIMHHNKSKTL